MSKNKVIITGGLGFIFSNFMRKVSYDARNDQTKDKYSFVSIDKALLSSASNNTYYAKNISNHYIADIADQHIINKIFEFEKPDFVINAAAESSVDHSLTNPNAFVTSNVLGTQCLVNASLKYGVKKFVQISTDEVLGSLKTDSCPSWTEDVPLNPRNPYAASKAAAEMMVKSAGISHNLNYNITRSANNYGPRQTADKFIPKVIKCILEDKPITIHGDGMQMRDWIYVLDNCDGVLKVLEQGEPNEIYHIGAGQEFSIVEAAQAVCNAMGKGHNLITHVPDPRKNAQDFRYSVDCSKIKKLGWSPSVKFLDGIQTTVEWYLNNKYFIK